MSAPTAYAMRALIVLLLGATTWQNWTLQDLSSRVAELESGTTTTQVVEAASSYQPGAQPRLASLSPAAEQAMVARVAAQVAEQQAEQPAPEHFREIIGEEFERLSEERNDREVAQRVEAITQSVARDVGALAEEYDIDEATEQEVVDLLTEHIWTRVDMHAVYTSGDITAAEADEKAQAIQQKMNDRIIGLLGEDVAFELFTRINN